MAELKFEPKFKEVPKTDPVRIDDLLEEYACNNDTELSVDLFDHTAGKLVLSVKGKQAPANAQIIANRFIRAGYKVRRFVKRPQLSYPIDSQKLHIQLVVVAPNPPVDPNPFPDISKSSKRNHSPKKGRVK